ncbi:MAG TPA: RNA polymerase sigma factor [Longimicrobiaceae bacterium]|nr:RNA polymerase sigma factor [Longimicrobiaceae bacterium]
MLVQRARDGDAASFDAIVDRYYGDCLRYAARMLGNRADAEEAVQDAFLRAYRSMGRYDHRDRLRGWLFRILVNRCRSLAEQRLRRRRVLERFREAEPPAAETWPEEPGDGPPEAVRAALAALPPDQREAFLLKHVEELSYEEMAELTGTGVSALKMRVKRACDRLRVLLMEVEHGRA